MTDNLLQRNYRFYFSITGWKLLLLVFLFIAIPYIAWELFWYFKVGSNAIKWHTWIFGGLTLVVFLVMPFRQISWFRRTWLIGFTYFFACFFIGEIHPFTRVPMYSSFQKEIPVFSLINDSGMMIPFECYTTSRTGELLHKYYSLKTHYSGSMDSLEIEEKIYSILSEEVEQNKLLSIKIDTAHLLLRTIAIVDDSILVEPKINSNEDE
jgi:hypothetical protein